MNNHIRNHFCFYRDKNEALSLKTMICVVTFIQLNLDGGALATKLPYC